MTDLIPFPAMPEEEDPQTLSREALLAQAQELRERIADLDAREPADMMSAENLRLVSGSAPEVCRDLPAPTHAFLGGTGGQVREILQLLLEKNPHVRIVATAVTLESAAALTACMREFEFCECVSLSIAKARAAGPYHLMAGQNPIYIFTLQNGGNTP